MHQAQECRLCKELGAPVILRVLWSKLKHGNKLGRALSGFAGGFELLSRLRASKERASSCAQPLCSSGGVEGSSASLPFPSRSTLRISAQVRYPESGSLDRGLLTGLLVRSSCLCACNLRMWLHIRGKDLSKSTKHLLTPSSC